MYDPAGMLVGLVALSADEEQVSRLPLWTPKTWKAQEIEKCPDIDSTVVGAHSSTDLPLFFNTLQHKEPLYALTGMAVKLKNRARAVKSPTPGLGTITLLIVTMISSALDFFFFFGGGGGGVWDYGPRGWF